jgi:hypothetical protein
MKIYKENNKYTKTIIATVIFHYVVLLYITTVAFEISLKNTFAIVFFATFMFLSVHLKLKNIIILVDRHIILYRIFSIEHINYKNIKDYRIDKRGGLNLNIEYRNTDEVEEVKRTYPTSDFSNINDLLSELDNVVNENKHTYGS